MSSRGIKPGRGNTGSGMDLGAILQSILGGAGSSAGSTALGDSSIATNSNYDSTFGTPTSQGGTGSPNEAGAYAYTKYGYDPSVDYQSPTIDNRGFLGKIFKSNTSKKLNQDAAIRRNASQTANQMELDTEKQELINRNQVASAEQDKHDAELAASYGTLMKSNIGGMTPQPTALNFDSSFSPVQQGQQIRNIYGNAMIGQGGLATTIPNAQSNLDKQMLDDKNSNIGRKVQTLTEPTAIQTGITAANTAQSDASNALGLSNLKGHVQNSTGFRSSFEDAQNAMNRKQSFMEIPREGTMWNLNDNSSISGMRPVQSLTGGMTIKGPDGKPMQVGEKLNTSWDNAKMTLGQPKPSQAALNVALGREEGPQPAPAGYQPPSTIPSQAATPLPSLMDTVNKLVQGGQVSRDKAYHVEGSGRQAKTVENDPKGVITEHIKELRSMVAKQRPSNRQAAMDKITELEKILRQ